MKGSQKVFTEDDKRELASKSKELGIKLCKSEEADLRSKQIRYQIQKV